MRWLSTALLVLATLVASAPLWWSLPLPTNARVIDQARFTAVDGEAVQVKLPHVQVRRDIQGRYNMTLDLPEAPAQPLYLFIPTFSYHAIIAVDGDVVLDAATDSLVPGITLGASALVPLSGRHVDAGRHVVDIRLQAPGIARGYLSALYVGTASQLVPYHRLRVLVFEYARMMVLACQLLLIIAILMVWLYRPRESLYGWFFVLLAVTTASYTGLLVDLVPGIFRYLPYAFAISMASVFILHVIALMINRTVVPRWLPGCVVAVPGACVLAMIAGVSPRILVIGVVTPLIVLSPLITVGISAWGVWVKKVQEAWLLLVPLCFFSLATLHDGAIIAGLLDGPVFLSLYYRQLLIMAIAIILTRRLGLSLNRLDGANAHLKQRLAAREAQLQSLYEQERKEAALRIRHEERHRLTLDLHDGVSGHLASIIALAELQQSAGIERSAREALDDLRLVIHSLDIQDGELMVALSGLRERLEPRLKRHGVSLEWSMLQLPEVCGITPTHALHVLRIVQEAVTNAIRHGPARRISVRGTASPEGHAHIIVENDGASCPAANGASGAGGVGMRNMTQRAADLGGTLSIQALADGTRLTLALPRRLPGASARGDSRSRGIRGRATMTPGGHPREDWPSSREET